MADRPGTYRDLEVYREGYDLALEIHKLTADFPVSERYLLADQLKRASRSIPANLAEGWGVHTHRNFGHYVSQALGSTNEMLVHLDFAKDLNYIAIERHAELSRRYDTLGKRLFRLRQNAKF